MLVLTRKYQEKIRIGHDITITVLRTKGKAVRLGIEAPADVPVIRGELTFDTSKRASEPGVNVEDGAEPEVSFETRVRSVRAKDPSWSLNTGSDVSNRPFEPAATRVELRRVPRDKVAEILPGIVAGSAPLRAMMNQR
jgi:carbon storage regulator